MKIVYCVTGSKWTEFWSKLGWADKPEYKTLNLVVKNSSIIDAYIEKGDTLNE